MNHIMYASILSSEQSVVIRNSLMSMHGRKNHEITLRKFILSGKLLWKKTQHKWLNKNPAQVVEIKDSTCGYKVCVGVFIVQIQMECSLVSYRSIIQNIEQL